MTLSSDSTAPRTIVLVHGFWVTPRSWEKQRAGAITSKPCAFY